VSYESLFLPVVQKFDGVPPEIYVAFPDSLKNEDVRKRVREWWLMGNQSTYAKLKLFNIREFELICKPRRIELNWKLGVIQILTPSDLKISLSKAYLGRLGSDIEGICKALGDFLYIRAIKSDTGLKATDIQALKATEDVDTARRIVEEQKIPPIQALIEGLGLKYNEYTQRIYLPRIVSWIRGFDGKPMHIMQFTPPNSGKTSFGLRSGTLFNWEYLNEVPTLARLVMDARGGTLGVVFLRDGMIFDEYDKWGLNRERVKVLYEVLLTGMEQGKWTRGTTMLTDFVPDVPRMLPVVFFGNTGSLADMWDKETPTRALVNGFYSGQLGVRLDPLIDRISWVDLLIEEITIHDHLVWKVLPDSIIRGLIRYIQDHVEEVNESNLRGRLWRHSNNLYAIFKALGVNATPKQVDSLVFGYINPYISQKSLESGSEPSGQSEVKRD